MAENKTQRLVEAAKTRMKAEREIDENTDTRTEINQTAEDERVETNRIEAAKELAKAKVQARANTMDGKIDVEARGDVKGDGGDAKDYADDDPDKALGVPVYEHGLSEVTATGEKFGNSKTLFGDRISSRTRAEMERGSSAISSTQSSRKGETKRSPSNRTTVTDIGDDPEGNKGAEEVQRKAEAAKKKAGEDKK